MEPAEVQVVNRRSLIAEYVGILALGDGYVLVGHDSDTDSIATALDPNMLSRYAFGRGAFEVEWKCDLREVERRFGARRVPTPPPPRP